MTGTITEQLGLWMADITRAAEHNPDVEVHLYGRETGGGRHVLLAGIRTAPGSRGQGMASDVMRRITRAADRHGAVIHLTPDPPRDDRPVSRRRLARWFGRLGFEAAAELSVSGQVHGTMVRYPRGEATELAHDAWRHEMRDAHGRWTRTPGSGVAAEGYAGQNRDSILAAWRDASDPEIKQHLNLAEAYLDDKPITAAFHIREAARIYRKNGDAGKASDLQILAARITGDDERRQSGQQAAQDFTAKASTEVPHLLGGGKLEWNGKVDVFAPGTHDRPDFHTLAFIDWDGKISMDADEAAKIRDALDHPDKPVADPAAFSVALHELIHGTIGGQTAQQRADWDKLNPWVQGVVEAFNELDRHNASAGKSPTLHGLDEVYRENTTLAPHHVEWAAEQGLITKESGSTGVYNTETGEYRQLPPKWMLTAKAKSMIPPDEPYNAHQRAYQDKRNADIEEGFTELGTVHHMPEFAERMGIGDRETNITAFEGGHVKVSPVYAKVKETVTFKLFDAERKLSEDPRPTHQQAAQAARRAVQSLSDDDISGTEDELKTLQHLGDPEVYQAVKSIQAGLDKMTATGFAAHATVSEYARRLQDPQRVEEGAAWGHYGWQTAAAQRWVRAIAKAEGRKPGSKPFQRRVTELSDEINREGAAGKVPAMVRQAMRAAKATDTYTDAGLLSDMMADEIRKHWEAGNQRAGSSAAEQVLADAKRHGRSGT